MTSTASSYYIKTEGDDNRLELHKPDGSISHYVGKLIVREI